MADTDVKTDSGEVDVSNGVSENTKNGAVTKEVKSDEPTDLEKKIIRQIEYYFGDYNLPRDKFLQEQMKEDEGWIPFDTLFKFKRLAGLSIDKDVVIAALEKSETQLVKVNEEKTKIRRAPEYPIPELNEERRKELVSRSVYLKGFPTDKKMNDVLSFFENNNITVENVHLRFACDKATKQFIFKGSVFATFKSVDECKKFIESGPYKYDDGPELLVKWQNAYLEEKRKVYAERREGQIKNRQAAENAEEDETEMELPACSILHLKGFSDSFNREIIKTKLEDSGVNIAYIEFNRGDSEAFVRLQGESAAADFMKTLEDKENKIEINDVEITVRALEGEEFEKHLEKIKSDIKKYKHMSRNKNKGKGGKGGGGNKGGYRKRKGGRHDDEPREKK